MVTTSSLSPRKRGMGSAVVVVVMRGFLPPAPVPPPPPPAPAPMPVRHRKSPGTHRRWSHGRQGRSSRSTASVGDSGGPPGRRSDRQRGPVQTDDRHVRRGRDVQRPAVAADEHRRARHQAAQLGKREFVTCPDRSPALRVGEPLPRLLDDGARRLGLGRSGRQDDTPNRVVRRKLHSQLDEVARRASGGTGCRRSRGRRSAGAPGRRRRRRGGASTAAAAAGDSSIPTRWRIAVRRRGQRPAEVGEQIPLVLDRMPRPQVGRARHDLGVHPRPPLDLVADAARRAGGPGQQRGARAAMEVDDEVEAGPAQLAGQGDVVGDAPPAADVRDDRDDVEAGMALDDRRRGAARPDR